MVKKSAGNIFWNVMLNVVVPSYILILGGGRDYLTPELILVIALAFPIGYGLGEYLLKRRLNFMSAVGLISILMTGGIGLLELSHKWLLFKEAGIPFLIAIFILISMKTRFPLVKTLINEIIDVDKIDRKFKELGHGSEFEDQIRASSYLMSAIFFVSTILNYLLVKIIIVSPPGTSQYNIELGKMTALSFPVIGIPAMVMLIYIIFSLIKVIKNRTGMEWDEVLR